MLPTKVQIRLGKRKRVKYHEIDSRIFPDLPRSGVRQSEEEKTATIYIKNRGRQISFCVF